MRHLSALRAPLRSTLHIASLGLALALAPLVLGGCGRPPRAVAPPPAVAPAALSAADIARMALPSVAHIRTAGKLGSGFIIHPDGLIATNLHVIAGEPEAVVTLSDGRTFRDPEVVGLDEAHDIAVLRIPASSLPSLTLVDLAAVHAGDRVVAIGHPLGLGSTVSDGLVSAVRVVSDSMTLLQVSAPIAPGSSGGPLLDDRGRVIGIATLMVTRGQNLNFGVPATYLGPLLASARPRPLAEVARETARPAPARAIPEHDIRVLDRCSAEDLDLIASTLGSAIQVGGTLFDEGNADGCFRILEGAALRAHRRLHGCVGAKKVLIDGVERADRRSAAAEKAWAMRDAFEGLLNVVGKKQKR
jgi:hypothetical protein